MLPCASTAEEVSLAWSHHRISLIDAQKLVFPYKTNIYSGTASVKITFHLQVYAVKPLLTATSVTRSPRYYGHFLGSPGKTAIHFLVKKPLLIRSPVNKANFFGPLMTVLTGFHCITFVWFFHFNLKY